VTALDTTALERNEKLEQLRWLENGYHISVATTEFATVGIDTPEDLVRAEELIKQL
jgi:3-deoxy-manno-octulosonate cytidylyltransferase (CMP-KDO synthetase)